MQVMTELEDLDQYKLDTRRVQLLKICRGIIRDIINGHTVTVKVQQKIFHGKNGVKSYKHLLREISLALISSEYPDPTDYSEDEKTKINKYGFRQHRRMN